MNYSSGESLVILVSSFRTSDLQTLLGAFYQNKTGRKNDLKERVIELLRTKPPGLDVNAFAAKIVQIHCNMQNERTNNIDHDQAVMAQQRLSRTSQHVQQPMQMIRTGLPQVMPQIPRGNYGNSNMPYQNTGPRNMMPNTRMMTTESEAMELFENSTTTSNSSFIPPLKKLPFFEVVDDVFKPLVMIGGESCTLTTAATQDIKEESHKFILSLDNCNLILLNRNISDSKNEYIYQVQIRICQIEQGCSEISDYMPLGLHIRLGDKICELPPLALNARPGTEARRIPQPINCSDFTKLSPNVENLLFLNWIPDGKTYVFSMHIVKQLTSDYLLEKLLEKEPRSSEETKNYIIKKYADVDPDLATTSYRFSLLCPLSKMRMAIPAKSIYCNHLQCFDARSFLQMNEKKPTWMCPTCNNPCLYDDIQIENYILEVVSSSKIADNTKEIEILADGTWKVYDETKNVKNVPVKENPLDTVNLDDSDDDNDIGASDAKKDLRPEGSNDSENIKSFIIDLTLSDEDEESPKEKEEQENEAQAVNAVQSATDVGLKPQAQVQPQQAVTSSEQVIEIDSSSPSSPGPTTSVS